MIDMESAFDALAEDPSGYRLKEIREELFAMKAEVKRAMDAGMTADEMAVQGRSWRRWNVPTMWPVGRTTR